MTPDKRYVSRMFFAAFGAAMLACLSCWPASAMDESPDDQDSYPGAHLSRSDWQRRIDEGRARARSFVETARERRASSTPLAREDADTIASEAGLTDPDLRKGDIVATTKGLMKFNGSRGRERQPGDFEHLQDKAPASRGRDN